MVKISLSPRPDWLMRMTLIRRQLRRLFESRDKGMGTLQGRNDALATHYEF